MRTTSILTGMFALAACDSTTDQPAGRNEPETPVAALKPSAPAKAFEVEETTDLIEFEFSWSAEAAAVPRLVSRLEKEMAVAKADLIAGAQESKAMRTKRGDDFNRYSLSTSYKTAGQTPGLLSLQVETWTYTGGAHGYGGTAALLWDRIGAQQIKFADLFAQAANRDRVMTQRWCDALNVAREQKRGEPVGGGGMFDECPPLDDIAIIPADQNGNGRFERLLMVASPYVAGPYAEGSYEIELPVTANLIAVIGQEYRPSFEAQPPQ